MTNLSLEPFEKATGAIRDDRSPQIDLTRG